MTVNGVSHTSPALDSRAPAEAVQDIRRILTRAQGAGADAPRSPDAVEAERARRERATPLKVNPQDLVLKPSEVKFEDRQKLVMSLEDVQRLLLLRSPLPERPSVQSLFESPSGNLVDLRS